MRTLAARCHFEEVIRRSRFLAHAAPCVSQADTLAFYESVADSSASHNCWAWRVNLQTRFNDDGEPGSTAGRPILGVIEGRELDRVMVVVTRWFGGVKLGVGGLKRAYSGVAAKCLDQAHLRPIVLRSPFLLEAPFEYSDVLHRLLARFDIKRGKDDFAESGLRMTLEIPNDQLAELRSALDDASRGDARLRPLDT
jgi:putative IMPACT (imprinted ancient) family translation regulator